ncbi:MAG: hypothetical protein ACLPKI_05015 [Streptosporangiaceae bacterium]
MQYTTKIINPGKARYGRPAAAVAPTLRQLLRGQDPALRRALTCQAPAR